MNSLKAQQVGNQFFRKLAAVLIGLVALGLIGNGSELLGLVAILVSFSLSVRGSFEVIFHVTFGLLVALTILAVFWLPQGTVEGLSFLEWIANYWFLAVFYAGLVFYTIIRHFSSRDEMWQMLTERFGVSESDGGSLDQFPSARGMMTIYDDAIPVTVYQTGKGFLAETRGMTPLLFPWSDISETHPPAANRTTGTVYIKKELGIPIPIEIPWAPQFRVMPKE